MRFGAARAPRGATCPPGGFCGARAEPTMACVTIGEIETTLPGGFLDARLRRVDVDYVERAAVLELTVDAGDPGAEDIGGREDWRPAHLVLSDLLFVVVEPPATRPEAFAGEARIAVSVPATAAQRAALPPVPPGFFCHAFFASNWNAHVFAAARDARLYWMA